jgi:hypothetical protein
MNSETLYNKSIVQTLLKVVPIYPIGALIKVIDIGDSTYMGFHGVVAEINKKNINNPVVILIKDKFLKKIKPIVIDTSKYSSIALEVIM